MDQQDDGNNFVAVHKSGSSERLMNNVVYSDSQNQNILYESSGGKSKSESGRQIGVGLGGGGSDVASVLSFHHLNYTIQTGKAFKKTSKRILRDVSGIFEPGLNAIMGPTGGGKTSLLDLLAKRKDSKGLQGDILLDGKPLPANFNLISGYVVQDDVIMGTLTVRENLQFAANLRMRNCSVQDKIERVDELLHDLGLEKCQNTKIGTDLLKGVSGGERKRCSIGIELVTKPSVLFLDEPTTGLDASTSFSVISLLRDLTVQANRTIVFSIHQPRFSIFKLVDKLHLLSCFGQTVYHGSAPEAVSYFARNDLECERYNNPPDFFLDVILQHSDSSQIEMTSSGSNLPKEFQYQSSKRDLPALFRNSVENHSLLALCDEILERSSRIENDKPLGYATNWCQQFYFLSNRSIKNLVRNPQTSIIPLMSMIILSVLVGCLYLDTEYDLSGFQNLYGALFFVALQMLFGNITALEAFIASRNLFLHESANGFYRVSSYFCAAIICDLIPLRTVPTLAFGTIFYLLVGLEGDVDHFAFFHLTNIVTTMCACSLCFFIGVTTGVYAVAQSLVSITFIIMMLFAGLILNVSSMPDILQPLQYISIPRYCLKAHAGSQLADIEFCGSRPMEVGSEMVVQEFCESGEDLLKAQDIDSDAADLWFNIGMLGAFTTFFFGLTYIALITIPKKK